MDNKLYKTIKSGNETEIYKVFNECYMKYAKLVYFVISQYIHNNHDIEDLTNEVFISFFNNITNLNLNKNIKGYLTTSAKNAALNFIKTHNKIEYNEEYITNISDHHTNNAYQELLLEMSDCLTKEEIDIIILHTVYDLKFKDISQQYNKPINTIISIYHRSIKKFRKFKGV